MGRFLRSLEFESWTLEFGLWVFEFTIRLASPKRNPREINSEVEKKKLQQNNKQQMRKKQMGKTETTKEEESTLPARPSFTHFLGAYPFKPGYWSF